MTGDDGQRRYCAADSNKMAAHLLARTAESKPVGPRAAGRCPSQPISSETRRTPPAQTPQTHTHTPLRYIITIPDSARTRRLVIGRKRPSWSRSDWKRVTSSESEGEPNTPTRLSVVFYIFFLFSRLKPAGELSQDTARRRPPPEALAVLFLGSIVMIGFLI